MFKLWGKRTLPPGYFSIGVHDDGVSLVAADRQRTPAAAVSAWEFRPYADDMPVEKVLAGLAADYHLHSAHCTTYLEPSDYRLLVADAPELPENELADAMRWRIKDVVDFDINEAVVDVFSFPNQDGKRENQPVYVVAAKHAALEKRTQLMEEADINLEVIDIPELALRNVASLAHPQSRGVALLSFAPHYGLITLTQQDVLYMSRTLNVGLQELREAKERASLLERIVLEVQRSLDYYVSHLHQAPVEKLLVTALTDDFPGIGQYFSEQLGMPVEILHLENLAQWNSLPPADMEMRFVTTFGAALRRGN